LVTAILGPLGGLWLWYGMHWRYASDSQSTN
jgi:hypothetical protein